VGIVLKNIDCLELLKSLPDYSVDLMLTDPPYGTTHIEWDNHINLAEMWLEWERVVKPNGAFVFTACQPFTSNLIISRLGFFKYELIWEKGKATQHANCNIRPLKAHENIVVFYRQQPTYNPQKEKGEPYKGRNVKNRTEAWSNYSNVKGNDNDGFRFPRSVIYFKSGDRDGALHPTQKPIDLFRYLIRTYSNPGETVFDGYSGSGTTAIACIKENRNFIGCELNKEYYDKSMERISIALSKPELFT